MSKEKPGHYTESGTRKYQSNGPQSWSRTFRAAAGKGREGEGIRAALAFAVAREDAFLAWVKAHPEASAPAARAAEVKAAKAASRPAKAKAAKPAKAKAAKPAKAKAAKEGASSAAEGGAS